MTKAYLIQSVQMGRGNRHAASTKDKPNVIDIPEKEFDRLEATGAVRKPTEAEIKIGYVEDAEVVSDTPPAATTEPASQAPVTTEPASQAPASNEPTNKEPATKEPADAELDAARAEYEELFGAKPGNMKLETLQDKIAKKKAENDAAQAAANGSSETDLGV